MQHCSANLYVEKMNEQMNNMDMGLKRVLLWISDNSINHTVFWCSSKKQWIKNDGISILYLLHFLLWGLGHIFNIFYLNLSIHKMGLIIVAKYNYFYKEQLWKCFVNSKALYKVKQLLSVLKHPFIGVANWIPTLLKEIKIKQAVLDNPV